MCERVCVYYKACFPFLLWGRPQVTRAFKTCQCCLAVLYEPLKPLSETFETTEEMSFLWLLSHTLSIKL